MFYPQCQFTRLVSFRSVQHSLTPPQRNKFSIPLLIRPGNAICSAGRPIEGLTSETAPAFPHLPSADPVRNASRKAAEAPERELTAEPFRHMAELAVEEVEHQVGQQLRRGLRHAPQDVAEAVDVAIDLQVTVVE